ncbi:MAG: shikimate kinase [Eubacteriales bacterium]
MRRQIILVGCMGCGKSSVGKALSKELQFELVDMDALIEDEEGRSISNIFKEEGEPYFRRLEVNLLQRVLKRKEDLVISVGGGLPITIDNQECLKSQKGVIYLKATVDTLWERVKGNTRRPLLQTANPKEKIASLLEEREEIYQMVANYIVETDGKSVKGICEEIKRRIQ